MHRFEQVVMGALLAAALVCPATAAVNDAAPNGFSVTQSVHIAAPPDKVYAELIQPNHWWNSQHTYSGSAANLSLDPKAGGCWCEKLEAGVVQHMTVAYAAPGEKLLLRGALGPLGTLGVAGAMNIELTAAGDGTDVKLTYNVGGYMKGGLESWAKPVDGVLGEQITRLKALLESGSPDPQPLKGAQQ